MNSTRFRAWRVVMLLLAGCSGCASAGSGLSKHNQIADILGRQAAAWNAGDIEAFMEPYWRSPDLTFSSGGRVTRGWNSTLDNYRQRYPTRDEMGRLAFSDLEITELGSNAALVLGRWRLERQEPVGGVFTLIMRKYPKGWVIVHDHTSRDAQ